MNDGILDKHTHIIINRILPLIATIKLTELREECWVRADKLLDTAYILRSTPDSIEKSRNIIYWIFEISQTEQYIQKITEHEQAKGRRI